MTFNEIAAFVVKKCGVDSLAARTNALSYALFRFDMIWGGRTWRMSQRVHSQVVPADVQVVTLTDPSLEKMINARWGSDLPLRGLAADLVFRADPAAWTGKGQTVGYVEIPKVDDKITLRLIKAPSKAEELLCLCKRKCPVLTGADVPPLEGATQAVVAYTMGDFVQGDLRQYSKAQIHFSEAAAHVQTMIENDTNQAAVAQQLTPEMGDSAGEIPWR